LQFLPLRYAGIGLVVPGVGLSNSNLWDCLKAKGAMRRFAGSSWASRYAKDAPSDASAFIRMVLAKVYGFSAVTILMIVAFD
jgi:hypothetical protein